MASSRMVPSFRIQALAMLDTVLAQQRHVSLGAELMHEPELFLDAA